MIQPTNLERHESVAKLFDRIVEPHLKWSINSLNLLKHIDIDGDDVRIRLALVTRDAEQIETVRDAVCSGCKALGFDRCIVHIETVNVATEGVAGVDHVILVAAGKGGVGKSNVAVNLATELSLQGNAVGLMDADIYGPSIPTMLGVSERPQVLPDEYLMPIDAYGMKVMSVGLLVPDGKSISWRGSMASGALAQFINKTFWGELDYLIIDLPPGTGDVPLTLAHRIKSDGVVVVTTPQDLVLSDVRRALDLFEECAIPVLGIVENMSFLTCEACGHEQHPFTIGPANSARELAGHPTLARLPLDAAIARAADCGRPFVLSASATARLPFTQLAEAVVAAARPRHESAAESVVTA